MIEILIDLYVAAIEIHNVCSDRKLAYIYYLAASICLDINTFGWKHDKILSVISVFQAQINSLILKIVNSYDTLGNQEAISRKF